MRAEEDTLKNYLRNKSLKLTPERRVVLKEIFSIHTHFTVDELCEKLRRKKTGISRATVYRAVPLFVKSGLIREVLRCEGKASYEHVFGHGHHDHIICVACGKIIEFKDDRLEELQERVCRKYGFMAVEHRLGIRGYCKKCRAKIKD